MSEALTIYDLNPGQLVAERYRIVGPHHMGGMYSAFEVEDVREGGSRELQFFPPALFESDEQADEFAASWQAWKRVANPAVLRVHDVLHLGPTTLAVISDLPPGTSLRQRMSDGHRPGPRDALRIGCQLLEGLTAIHEQGLVHGDIKPNTVHVDGDGERLRACLIDGGITSGLWSAKDLGEQTALIGTPYYAPPEQFSGDPPTIQSDVYNVATLLFELLTGVLPWSGANILEVFQAKLDREPPSIARRAPEVEVDPRLEQVIVGGLMAERPKRYASAREFLDGLRAIEA